MKLSSLLEAFDTLYQDDHGFIKGKMLPDGYYWVEKLYIYPEYRGQGYAKELAKHIPQKAKLLAQPLSTKSDPAIPKNNLINFYKSLGFEEHPDVNDNMIMIRESLLIESTIRLEDLYDEHELNDESETLYHWLDDEDLDKSFEVKTMNPEQAKLLKTSKNDMTVYDSYKEYATSSQKKLIQQKAKNYDFNRIIVIAGETVVDGNHQVIASILSNQPLKYIDLYS